MNELIDLRNKEESDCLAEVAKVIGVVTGVSAEEFFEACKRFSEIGTIDFTTDSDGKR